mmetsp:Transcript_21963/g.40284  ORF Transcript_21963/g.40284 Transcript_21963/m.40284 type:complete len:188 (+) Transcript_21963:187-750(+)
MRGDGDWLSVLLMRGDGDDVFGMRGDGDLLSFSAQSAAPLGVDSWDERGSLISLRGLSRARLGDSEWLGWRTARGGFTGWTFFVLVGVGALDDSVGSVLAAWSVRESAIRNGWWADCPGWWIHVMGFLYGLAFHGSIGFGGMECHSFDGRVGRHKFVMGVGCFFSWAYAVWDQGALGRRNIGEFGAA